MMLVGCDSRWKRERKREREEREVRKRERKVRNLKIVFNLPLLSLLFFSLPYFLFSLLSLSYSFSSSNEKNTSKTIGCQEDEEAQNKEQRLHLNLLGVSRDQQSYFINIIFFFSKLIFKGK